MKHAAVRVLLVAGALGAAAACVGATTAGFSDHAGFTNRSGAGTVVLGADGSSAPFLGFAGLVPAQAITDELRFDYLGDVPADLSLQLGPVEESPMCRPVAAGGWGPAPGGALEIQVADSGWRELCSLAGDGDRLPLRTAVAPGTADLAVTLAARLRAGTDHRWSLLAQTVPLTVHARQSSDAGAFSDYVIGGMEVSVAELAPAVPAECGSNQADCLVGGAHRAGDRCLSHQRTPKDAMVGCESVGASGEQQELDDTALPGTGEDPPGSDGGPPGEG